MRGSGPDGPLVRGISAVVPVFNGAETLPGLTEEIERALGELGRPFELILVDDDSDDGSWQVIRGLAERRSWIRGVALARNYGQHAALLCGIRAARHEVVVTLDDDGQNPPAAIPQLLAELERGYDLVYGTAASGQHGLWRNLASWLTKRALRAMTRSRFPGSAGSFRLFRTRLRDAFAAFDGPAVSIEVLLSWATTRVGAVTVEHRPRTVGRSNYGPRSLARHAIDMITGFSTLPLHLASWVGFALTLFGVLVLAWVLVNYLIHGGAVPGFAFLASIIVIFGGGQLFAIGLIGEYLARMHGSSMRRPAFVVAETTEPAAVPGPRAEPQPVAGDRVRHRGER